MAEAYRIDETIGASVSDAYNTIKRNIDWNLEFEHISGKEAELVYLTGMFSGARVLALWSHGARKALVFIKLIESGSSTRLIVITGGSETFWGFDWGRHRRNVERITGLFKQR